MINYKCTFGLKEKEYRRGAKVNAQVSVNNTGILFTYL
jgi:hypothetical protein